MSAAMNRNRGGNRSGRPDRFSATAIAMMLSSIRSRRAGAVPAEFSRPAQANSRITTGFAIAKSKTRIAQPGMSSGENATAS